MSNDLVVKSNALVEAGYQLTANEQRLILCAISKIPKGKPIDYMTGYCVSKSDFVDLGVNPKTAYREIREACERLFNRYVSVKTEQGEFKTRWVQDIMKFDEEWNIKNQTFLNGVMGNFEIGSDDIIASITFSRSVIPYLTELKDNFTQYMLSDIAGFSSGYSFRIYEFLMQFKSTKFARIGIYELRNRLDLVDKYPLTSDLRRWVIDVAIKEINEKSPYEVKYRLTKTGRKYTHLEMRFKPKEDKKEKVGLTDKQLARITRSKKFIDDYAHLVSSQSPENQSIDEWTATFVKKLKEEPKKFKKRPLKEYLDDEQAKRW